jgi:hypothetical protein
LACWPGRRQCWQVTVPDGGHARIELPGVLKQLVRPLVVALGVRRPGAMDQPPGGDLLPVLLPQPGAGGVRRGGLVDKLPGPVQVPGTVGLVGGHSRAVGLHAGAVVQAAACHVGLPFALSGDAGGPAQHGRVVAAGDMAAVVGVCLVRRVCRGPGSLDVGGGVRGS